MTEKYYFFNLCFWEMVHNSVNIKQEYIYIVFRERCIQYVEPKSCQKCFSEHMSQIYAFVGCFTLTSQQLFYFVSGTSTQTLSFTPTFRGT